jgi:hypothetical protein
MYIILKIQFLHNISRKSAINIVVRPMAGHQKDHGSIPGIGKKFYLIPDYPDCLLGPNQPSVQWILAGLSTDARRPRSESDSSHYLVLRLRMSGAIPAPHEQKETYCTVILRHIKHTF